MIKFLGVIKDISWIGFVLRTFIVGILVYIVGRFITKRTVNQLTAYDFILVWILGVIISAPLLDGEISFQYVIVPLGTLFFLNELVSRIALKSRKIGFFFNGKPIILIDNGKIIRSNLKKHFINVDLLLSELRFKNIFNIGDVKYAILEPNGRMSVIKKEEYRPVTPKDLKLKVDTGYPIVIIIDGKILNENLSLAGIEMKWLEQNLEHYNVKNASEVYLATVDHSKKLYIAKK